MATPEQTRQDLAPRWRRKVLGTICAVAAIITIGWLDYISGPQIGFALFYLVPVILSGFWLGRTAAIVTALASSAAWFSAEFFAQTDYSTEILVWNGFTRSAIFLTIGVMTALLRRDRHRLQVLLKQANENARTDSLTGLSNLRAFQEAIGDALRRARRGGKPVCLAYLDLDNFKKVNDHYGHSAGNQVLVRVADLIRTVLRDTDLPARLGGDEFAILLWNMQEDAGRGIADRLLQGITAIAGEYPVAGLGLSIGVILFDAIPADSESLLRQADAAMYQAKSAGKGRAVVLRA